MVFEPLGPNLLTLLATHKEQGSVTACGGLAMDLVRVITRQILLGVQYLHEECKLIHTDIKVGAFPTLLSLRLSSGFFSYL